MHVVLALLVLATCVFPAPLPNIINHRHIVMTLHGLMEHVDVQQLKEAHDNPRAHAAASAFLSHANSTQLKTCHSESLPALTALFSAADLNSDNRLMLDEFSAFLWAAARAASSTISTRLAALAASAPSMSYDQALEHTHASMSEATARALFKQADKNNDNHLSGRELGRFLAPELYEDAILPASTALLMTYDADADKTLSADEFLTRVMEIKDEGGDQYSAQAFDYRAERAERLREFHRDLDLDHDDRVSLFELNRLLLPTHHLHAVNEAYILFLTCDSDGDHELEQAEMQSCCHTAAKLRSLDMETEILAGVDKLEDKLQKRFHRLVKHTLHDEL